MNTSARMLAGASHMPRFTRIRATMALAIILCTIGSASANLITNGNFSANANAFTGSPGYAGTAGNPSNITNWVWNFSGRFGVNGISTGTSGAPITTFGPTAQQTTPDRNWVFLETIITGTNAAEGGAVYQTFSVTPGVEYTVSYEAANTAGDNTNGIVNIFNGDLGPGTTFANGVNQRYETANFQPYSFTFTPTLSQATIVLQAGSVDANQGVNFTNVSVVPVPEPGAFALAGIGIAAVASGFRRRRSHWRT